jgi:hypothetical protein
MLTKYPDPENATFVVVSHFLKQFAAGALKVLNDKG